MALNVAQRLMRTLHIATELADSLQKIGRMTCSGRNILDENGNPFIIRGFVNGYGELCDNATDPAEDLAMGANTVRIMCRAWGNYSLPILDGQQIGAPCNLSPAYLTYLVAQVVAYKALGFKVLLAFDSNCGQGDGDGNYCAVGGLPGQNFWTINGSGELADYITMQRGVIRTLRGLVDMVEPIVEPNPPDGSQIGVSAVQNEMRSAILLEDEDMLFVMGAFPAYENVNLDNVYNKALWGYQSNTILTCDELNNALTGGNFAADVANIVSVRHHQSIPVMIQQIGTESSSDPTDTLLDAGLGLCDNAANGSIGYTVWDKVDRYSTSYGIYSDPGSGRVLKPNRKAVIASHFSAPAYPANPP